MSAKLLVPGISGLPNKTKKKQLEESKSYSVTFLQGFPPGSGTGEPELTHRVQVRKQLQNHKVIIYQVWLKKSQMKSDGLATLTKFFSRYQNSYVSSWCWKTSTLHISRLSSVIL